MIILLLVRRLHLQLCQWLAKFIPSFFISYESWLTKQTRNYYALIGAEEEISSEAFTWSRACTFSFNKNSIGKAIADATATRLHLSVHSTAPMARRQAHQPISSAECLMHGAAHASQRAPPHPASRRPAANVHVGAPSVAPSAHATRAGASGDVDVGAAGTHAARGVAAAAWVEAQEEDGLAGQNLRQHAWPSRNPSPGGGEILARIIKVLHQRVDLGLFTILIKIRAHWGEFLDKKADS